MATPFLRARWANLINLTYAVDPALVEPHVPPHVQLDVRDGRAFVSFVAFDFLDTRVLGVPWPGFRNFPELNLRSYARRGDTRGVFFIREYVPQRLVAAIARGLYNEPYHAAPMTSATRTNEGTTTFELSLDVGGRAHFVRCSGSDATYVPDEASAEHYFKEHSHGWGATRSGRPLTYHVAHPVWACRPIVSLERDVDFGVLYGEKWAVLNAMQPMLSLFAVGSEVSVYPKEIE